MYTFDEIVGHEEIINYLQNTIKNNKVSHAYILDGEKGIGKNLVANTFAKTLLCEERSDTPCDNCTSCRTFDSLNNPDVIYVEQTKKTGIGVNDIREQINQDINIKPYAYPYKIYIVNDADTMTQQAQNALLKTIEEPPEYVIILLLSNNINGFLRTILSRCVVLKLKPIKSDKIMNYIINNLDIPDYRAELITSFAQGIIGKAKELASSSEFLNMRDSMINIVECIIKGDDYEKLDIVSRFDEYKDTAQDFLDLFMIWFRDLLIIKKIDDESLLINRDKYRTLLKQSQVLSYNKISMIFEKVNNTKNLLKQNVNFKLAIEMMVL